MPHLARLATVVDRNAGNIEEFIASAAPFDRTFTGV
jgi:hypothetical protein